MLCRFCRRLVHLFAPWLAKAKTFRALSSVVRAKGLPLVVLIRFCVRLGFISSSHLRDRALKPVERPPEHSLILIYRATALPLPLQQLVLRRSRDCISMGVHAGNTVRPSVALRSRRRRKLTPLRPLLRAITPKLGIHVWVGSKAFLLADPESRNKMDTATKWLNTGYIVFGTVVGIATSWYLYKVRYNTDQSLRYSSTNGVALRPFSLP